MTESKKREKEANKKEKGVVVEKTLPFTEAVSYLEALLEQMKRGQIVLQHEGTESLLSPADSVKMVLKTSTKKQKQKFSFKLKWQMPEAEEQESVSSSPSQGALENPSENDDKAS